MIEKPVLRCDITKRKRKRKKEKRHIKMTWSTVDVGGDK